MERPELLDHQKAGIERIDKYPRILIADEPGIGKTAQAIRALDGGRNLVVAPAMVLDSGTWDNELAVWSDYPDRWVQAPFTKLNEREILASGGNRPIAGKARAEFQGPWDAIVVDEAHYTKNRGTNWTTTIEHLARQSGRVVEQTGTPIPNWASDIFPMLRVMHPEEQGKGREYGSYWRWAEKWFDIQPSRFGGPNARVVGDLLECNKSCMERPAHKPCKHYRRFMEENFGKQWLRRLREDCLDLPPMLGPQDIATPLSKDAARMYREFKVDFSATTTAGEEFEAWTNGSKTNLMTRLTTSPWMLDKIGEPSGGKFEQLKADLRDRTRPTFAVAHYRDTVEAIARVGHNMGLRTAYLHGGSDSHTRRRLVSAFQEGKIDLLSGSLEVVSEGITLTRADMCIIVEKSWKPSRNHQAIQRIHRLGQANPCTVRAYVTPRTIDAARSRILEVKTDRQIRMMSAAEFYELM